MNITIIESIDRHINREINDDDDDDDDDVALNCMRFIS